MILPDTSIWIRFLHSGDAEMDRLLALRRVLMHPMVLGELAMGMLKDRNVVLEYLSKFTSADQARHEEVVQFVSTQGLFGSGIGFIDAHLLTAVRLSPGTHLWTSDKRLHAAADSLGLAFKGPYLA